MVSIVAAFGPSGQMRPPAEMIGRVQQGVAGQQRQGRRSLAGWLGICDNGGGVAARGGKRDVDDV